MSMDTISDNTSGATDDTLRAAFEALGNALSFERYPADTPTPWLRGEYKNSATHTRWIAYRAGYEHAIRDAAATVDAMITSPTDIILCADTIDEAAARIRRLGAK